MPRGRTKKSHKGGHRHFTSEDQLKVQQEKEQREREWRKKQGIESDEEDEVKPGAASDAAPGQEGAAKGLPPSSSESSSDESEDDKDKFKGVQHMIDIENPNRVQKKTKKVSQLDADSDKPQLTRKEREEIEKQQAKANYMKMHLAGKTDEARTDMARLALIRKQREEQARKRDEEKKEKDDLKVAAEQRLLDKKSKAK